MLLKGLSLMLLLLVPINGYDVTIALKNYEGDANLRIFNESGLIIEKSIQNREVITLSEGNYTFELNALNKTLIKKHSVESDETLEFNLGFTNSTENLSIMLHTIVAQNGSVDEVIVVSNKGELNFEGDIEVPMPAFANLQILSTNLDFLSYEVSKNSLIFRSLLIPDNSSGSIRMLYRLSSDEMERELAEGRVVIIPLAEILEKRNLTLRMLDSNGEKIFVLEGNGSYYIKFKFMDYSESPLPLIAILLISVSLFFLFFEKRGRWKE